MSLSKWLKALPVAAITACVAIPIVVILAALFAPDTSGTWGHLASTVLTEYAANSLILMVSVGLITIVIGVTSAWLIAATEFPGRRLFSWMLILPLAAPAYVIAYTYVDLLAPYGPVQAFIHSLPGLSGVDIPSVRTLPAAVLFLSLVLYPYVYMLARASFETRAGHTFEAARMLGASPASAFRRVALPASRPAIAAGVALVMMETLADFGVVDYFAIPTLSTGIYRTWIGMGEKLAALKIAGVMLLFVFVLVTIESATRRGQASMGESSRPSRLLLSRSHKILACLGCLVPVLLGFIIPTTALLAFTIQSGDNRLSDFVGYAVNSVTVSSLASVCAVLLAVILAYVQRRSTGWLSRSTIRLATMGYALPGILIAIGILGSTAGLDRFLTGLASEHLGYRSGLVLSGTLVLLVYAYLVRFLTVSYNSVNAGLSAIPHAIDDAARSLGASPLSLTRRIHAPLMIRSLGAGLLLVFVDSMRELPATLILRPFNFETLATRVYRLASDERLMEASTSALTIILIGIIPVLLLNRLGSVSRKPALY
ncbi:iron ABC transporter permease [Aquisalinus flavus]|nr:iron ABC transporter permease [Aquisalinus flavus]UNE49304.1 iron ABC transporter permease [Aquisalinus flavus]